jgi:hypothetical protein
LQKQKSSWFIPYGLFQNSIAIRIMFEGCIFDDRERDGFSVQVQVESPNASMPIQRSKRADGERHRFGWQGQAGGAPFHQLDRPGRHDLACRIQQDVPAGRPA